MNDEQVAPRQYLGVMVSSTFTDLEEHRAALIKAIEGQGMYPVAMEHDAALPDHTVIESSWQKVHEASAYIGIISHKYGQIPDSAEHNPDDISLTELEFREARRLGRPMLIFIMGENHRVRPADVERDQEKTMKLDAFRKEVKRVSEESPIERVYYEFNNLHQFELAAVQSVVELRRFLDLLDVGDSADPPDDDDGLPRAPALYAEPRFIGSHAFVGRTAELRTLSGWAAPADSRAVLLFDAIGGTGKSMLTWEWTVNHASGARTDWAGAFWYSFYEKGAVMTDFCRRALAYMTGRPVANFQLQRQPELSGLLLVQLQSRPWLLVLDGLERVLVAYQRYDAAQLADEEAGLGDEIGRRDPATAIRPWDDELLRALAGANPSKILITSRLVPRTLLNQAGRPIPGVLHKSLGGLHPVDAEALLRACGIHGSSWFIQDYLQRHCDCHPLVTGILAGLIHDYLPDRGNFDRWAGDSRTGVRLNLAELNLVQKRNHILEAAMSALPDRSRQLLSTLALLSEAVDYDTLQALNPHLHPLPDPPRKRGWSWNRLLAAWRRRRADPERDASLALADPQTAALELLTHTVHDLERRGLLQYDQQARRYDLHPVVRGFAAGSLGTEDRDRYGQRAVDYFSQRSRDPYESAETLDDVENALQLVHALLQISRSREALPLFRDGLIDALFFNLEASPEVVSLLRPFFDPDWTSPLAGLTYVDASYVVGNAAFAFYNLGDLEQSLAIHEVAVGMDLKIGEWPSLQASLARIARIFAEQNHLAKQNAYIALERRVAELTRDAGTRFRSRYDLFEQMIELGQWKDAVAVWQTLQTGRDWPRSIYRPGMAEAAYALLQFQRGSLTEECLADAEQLAQSGLNRPSARALYALRGEWHLKRHEWAQAVESLHEAIRMTREAHLDDTHLVARLALARFRLDSLPDARSEAIRLSNESGPAQLALAELWDAIGDTERAVFHAQAAYQWAWADGEPFVHRYQLDRARALLELLGTEIPALAAFDPDWEHKHLPASASKVRKVLADLHGDWLPASRPVSSDVD
jgi:tetratricopeptide (TPR) repeat protein